MGPWNVSPLLFFQTSLEQLHFWFDSKTKDLALELSDFEICVDGGEHPNAVELLWLNKFVLEITLIIVLEIIEMKKLHKFLDVLN